MPDRVAAGDERPDVGGAAQALGEDLGPAIEPDRGPVPVERPAIARVDDRAAARRDHAPDIGGRIGGAEVGDRRAFQRPKGRLPVLGEDVGDRPPGRRLDPLVEVDERRRAWCLASRRPTTLLPLPGSPTSTTSIAGPQSSPPEPASSVPVRPCASIGPSRRTRSSRRRARGQPPPATGASGAAAIRDR